MDKFIAEAQPNESLEDELYEEQISQDSADAIIGLTGGLVVVSVVSYFLWEVSPDCMNYIMGYVNSASDKICELIKNPYLFF